HLLPELRGRALAVEQRQRAQRAELPVEERAAARLDLEQRFLRLRRAQAQVAGRVLQVLDELLVDLLQHRLVLDQRGEPRARRAVCDLDRAVGDAQRAVELHAQAPDVVERLREVRLERTEAVLGRVGREARGFGLPRLPCRDAEDLGAQAQEL